MKNANINIDLKSLKSAAGALTHKMHRYAGVLLFLLFMAVYGYTIAQVNSLSNPTVSPSEVAAETKALPTPRMDEAAAKKLQSLKDNSVNVQTLFDEDRTNPFE